MESYQSRHKELFGQELRLSWQLPASLVGDKKRNTKTRRVNRFLRVVEKSLMSRIMKDKSNAFKWYKNLVYRSHIMKAMILYKSNKDFYQKWDRKATMGHIIKFTDMFRKMDYRLGVKRIYIEKSNGKLRPIGSPSPSTKMLYMSMLLFLEKSAIFHMDKSQYGFIKGRGVVKAGLKVLEYLRAGYKVYEYDLQGFFNRVSPTYL